MKNLVKIIALFALAAMLANPFICHAGTTDVQYLVADLGTLGGSFVFASAMNNRGAVVGHSTTNGTAAMHAFIYSNGALKDMGTLGGTNSYGYAINDSGQAVGAAYLSN